MTVRLRRARPTDAAALAEFGARTFKTAYRGLMTDAELDGYVARTYGEAQQRDEMARPDSVVLMAEDGDRLAGFAWIYRGPRPPCVTVEDAVSLSRIYVDPAGQSHGVGRQLLAGAMAEARGMGGSLLWLAVWQRNPRAVAFYRREGFTELGRTGFETDPDPACDLVMARGLMVC